MLVDGEPVTNWLVRLNGFIRLNLPLGIATHIAQPEVQGLTCICYQSKPFVVNDTAGRCPSRTRGPRSTSSDLQHIKTVRDAVRARLLASVCHATEAACCIAIQYQAAWIRNCGVGAWPNDRATMKPRWQKTPKGDVICVKEQKCSYGSAISLREFEGGPWYRRKRSAVTVRATGARWAVAS